MRWCEGVEAEKAFGALLFVSPSLDFLVSCYYSRLSLPLLVELMVFSFSIAWCSFWGIRGSMRRLFFCSLLFLRVELGPKNGRDCEGDGEVERMALGGWCSGKLGVEDIWPGGTQAASST